APVCRPRPCPVGMDPQARRILRTAPRKLRSRLRPGPAINPDAARSCSIILQPGKTRQLLATFDHLLCLGIGQIGKGLAVKFLGQFGKRWMLWISVRPRQIQDGIRELTAFLLVQLTYL